MQQDSFVIMSFCIKLISDSSMSYFPENKISHFITRLPKPIELRGEWENGMVELLYPHTGHNVNNQNNLIGFETDTKLRVGRRLPPGCYESVPDILKAIYVKEHDDKIFMSYNDVTKRVQITVKNNAKLVLYPGLAEMLGFEPMEITSFDASIETTVVSPLVADPSAHYRVLMIYTDVVEPQIVGDVLAPLLRVVRVRGQDGEMISEQYDRPHYLPVNRKMIETLEIVIRTHAGCLAPFERGRSYVKLHFRQKSLS